MILDATTGEILSVAEARESYNATSFENRLLLRSALR